MTSDTRLSLGPIDFLRWGIKDHNNILLSFLQQHRVSFLVLSTPAAQLPLVFDSADLLLDSSLHTDCLSLLATTMSSVRGAGASARSRGTASSSGAGAAASSSAAAAPASPAPATTTSTTTASRLGRSKSPDVLPGQQPGLRGLVQQRLLGDVFQAAGGTYHSLSIVP